MLSDKIKQVIRTSYKSIGENLTNFNPRQQQTFLIAEIAKTLAGDYDKVRKIITIEAGTGTGKSLAYALGAIPLALNRNKKVCIATATVALQEQLVDKDLPFLKKYSGLDFNFTLAKGRQRYVCRQKLAQAVANDDSPQAGFTFAEKPQASDIRTLNKMHQALNDNSWPGDIDAWPESVNHHIWQQIQADKHSCLKHVSEHSHCPFHKARETMDAADVLVVNHSLLLADLELGGGKILPAPEDTFYIIDEAHHLPKVTRDHSSANLTLKGAIDWLSKLPETGDKIAKLVNSNSAISPSIKMADDCQDILADMQKVLSFIDNNRSLYFHQAVRNSKQMQMQNQALQFRFENGVIPQSLKDWAEDLTQSSKKCLTHLNKLYNLLMESVKDGDTQMYLAEPLLAESGFMIQRLENFNALWQMYAKTDSDKGAPMARWLEQIEGKRTDYLMSGSPIEVGFTLENMLWSKCEGAVLCSATILALNSFDHFRRQAGLRTDDGSQYQKVDSPFDYQNNAQLIVPKMQYEPSADQFTDELIAKLPEQIKRGKATLVLFSSYWQMDKVVTALREQTKLSILVQGEQSRQKIIETHKALCDKKEDSIIFGTQSFSEGLDLPGDYLTNVIITKLPFSVPSSPVEEAQAEYITAKGGNPFMSISVPETSKKLIQATGRLLRNEKDYGVIILMDRRVVNKRYGKDLLNSLPPFKRIIE
ncbi:ATP-dependent DNA helicase DinG [Colwellia sp. MB02u-18]|uniref:ATP-dependent DNA helicase DinG n=1 Tax=unclassified Colwellia TaxID=196834 RepID=UPI0015F5F1CB|nr:MULTISPECIES: ATP-dependent DNA helicase DinG [unclassified Colwellia]MBA6225301.1 ATP-dependent DNA helicase DinG [Colwellia sp. MB3u-45]MBA6267249.1 ATP-dependent DNA helicase DinG [Colwellia sp. MB3u-43]MBA6322861.1 ATP-dependent DNA helicase DinG [Colwellia sp. MB02u-19]MBA6324731.1 ATP-dependent DNA helicase DinG [Colwellia sp. MB02u-18]MBA6331078.1 ATP-dependent DNA helicase DinG [Colwellia sp. MB02u-12]